MPKKNETYMLAPDHIIGRQLTPCPTLTSLPLHWDKSKTSTGQSIKIHLRNNLSQDALCTYEIVGGWGYGGLKWEAHALTPRAGAGNDWTDTITVLRKVIVPPEAKRT